jgi:hypothetical protein
MRWAWLTLLLLIASCANKNLRCDGALRPINPQAVGGAEHRR